LQHAIIQQLVILPLMFDPWSAKILVSSKLILLWSIAAIVQYCRVIPEEHGDPEIIAHPRWSLEVLILGISFSKGSVTLQTELAEI
jgi:hypothetical protein